MAYTITQDSIQSTDYGYSFAQGDEVTIAAGILVSSTESKGVYSVSPNSRLINNGHVASSGIGTQFSGNDSSIVNAAGASITSIETGVKFLGDRPALANYGTIRGFSDYGALFTETTEDGSLVNFGSIVGRNDGVVYSASTGSGKIVNAADITGFRYDGIYVNGSYTVASGTLTIFNAVGATITGPSASIVSYATDTLRILIDNRGTLNGDVVLDDSQANNVLVNRGTIRGEVILSEGNDVFNGAGGRSGAVSGGSGNDTLAGGGAADRLNGELGNDLLIGRAGPDRFVFDTALNTAANTDTIRDFAVNVDKILLSGGAGEPFAAAGPLGVLAAGRFHVGPAAADASDRIIYNPNTGALFYDHDGRGGDPQIRFAELTKHLALDHADFLVVLPLV